MAMPYERNMGDIAEGNQRALLTRQNWSMASKTGVEVPIPYSTLWNSNMATTMSVDGVAPSKAG